MRLVAEITGQPLPSSLFLSLLSPWPEDAAPSFMVDPEMNQPSLTRFAWLSIAAAIVTMGLKTLGYWLTGSVGLLSDAIESLVNLFGGIMALAMLTIAARPADEDHAFGHSKAEYFSSGVEGTLILVAAVSIAVAAVKRILTPRALEQIGLGLGVSVVASLINLAVALLLSRVGRKNSSITLEANAQHLLTDVWTSAGVLAGVGLVALTGWNRLDPIVALLVAANIVWTGIAIVRRSVAGLMDQALPIKEQEIVKQILSKYEPEGIQCHDLRTRQAAAHRFVSVHVLTPGTWTVKQGHDLLERLEKDLGSALPNLTVSTHLEPLEDPASARKH
jgi:cation diffusion facilitator family transporter